MSNYLKFKQFIFFTVCFFLSTTHTMESDEREEETLQLITPNEIFEITQNILAAVPAELFQMILGYIPSLVHNIPAISEIKAIRNEVLSEYEAQLAFINYANRCILSFDDIDGLKAKQERIREAYNSLGREFPNYDLLKEACENFLAKLDKIMDESTLDDESMPNLAPLKDPTKNLNDQASEQELVDAKIQYLIKAELKDQYYNRLNWDVLFTPVNKSCLIVFAIILICAYLDSHYHFGLTNLSLFTLIIPILILNQQVYQRHLRSRQIT